MNDECSSTASAADRSKSRLTLLAGTIVVVAFLTSVSTYVRQINDDAFITFRYSRFLAAGDGPLFNPGERVEGYTNFLLMLLIAPVIAVGGPDAALPFAKFVGVAGGVAALIATQRLSAAWLRRAPSTAARAELGGWGAAALVAADYCFAMNSTTGLETALFAALIAWGVYLDQCGRDKGTWCGAGAIFALAALTRPEGAAAFAVVFLGRLVIGEWRDSLGRRRMVGDALLVGAIAAAQLAFRYAYYDGEIVPNTYWAKRGGFAPVSPSAYVMGFVVYSMSCVVPVLAILPVIAARPLRGPCLPAFLLAVASLASVFSTGSDWMRGYRLLVPYWPEWAALAVCGLAWLSSLARALPPATPAVAAAALAVGVFVFEWPNRETARQNVEIHAAGYESGHTALARWLAADADPGDTVALMDIGIVGYLNPQLHILDITGLTDRHIAKLPGGFLRKELDPSYVLDRRPRYIVVVFIAPKTPTGFNFARTVAFSPMEFNLLASPEFQRDYHRARAPLPGDSGEAIAAAVFGATRVFLHHDPDPAYYFLAAYKRAETAASAPPGR